MASSSDALSALAGLLRNLFQIARKACRGELPSIDELAEFVPEWEQSASVARRSFDPALGVAWQAVDSAIADGEKQLLELFALAAPGNVAARNAWRDENWMAAIEAEQRLRELAEYLSGDQPGPDQGGSGNPSQSGSAKLSPRELASNHQVDAEALRKRLDRWRHEHDAGYVEVSNPAPREPKYLYDELAVMPVIDALKAKPPVGKRAANGQQKKL